MSDAPISDMECGLSISALRMPTLGVGSDLDLWLALLLLKIFIVSYAVASREEEVLGIVIHFAIFLEASKLYFDVGKSFNIARL